MMKSLPVAVVIVISAIALNQSAYANPETLSEPIIQQQQAAALTTEPATLNSNWANVTNETNNLTNNSVSLIQERSCENLNPLDLLNNADTLLKECTKPRDNRSAQRVEPVEYFKVPRLDSGLRVTVTKF